MRITQVSQVYAQPGGRSDMRPSRITDYIHTQAIPHLFYIYLGTSTTGSFRISMYSWLIS